MTALLIGGACAAGLPALASGAIAWRPCADAPHYGCARLSVPADPAGVVPGRISLSIRRLPAALGGRGDAVVALAGGPGQAALPFAQDAAQEVAPALAHRDLIVFDQRGTGTSDALRCSAFEHVSAVLLENPPGSLVARCAQQIGPLRNLYTTEDSVADIEAVRAAAGYARLVLFGISYGTKVALDYARAHPSHVESLVLDSTMAADGPDVYSRSTFAAIGRILTQLCAGGTCAGITSSATGDLAALAAALRMGPMHALVVDSHGAAVRVSTTVDDLVNILVAGDLDPTLRADFPGAVRSALLGDAAPLARLKERVLAQSSSSEGIDIPLNVATTCEDLAFSWDRGAPTAQRLGQAQSALSALPAATFAPFDTGTALNFSPVLNCAAWPYDGTQPPPSGGTLADVPTLILSGEADLRTPTEDAQSVAAQIPGSWLVAVPHSGHSVLGSELGSCGERAVRAFFGSRRPVRCPYVPLPALELPTPVAPQSLSEVSPLRGVAGLTGRTVHAVAQTLQDTARQFELAYLDALNNGSSPSHLAVGGLRGGWAHLDASGTIDLHAVSYVPGVTVSGTAGSTGDSLRVGGPAGARGVLHALSRSVLSGSLGGRRVRIDVAALAGG